MKKKLSKVLAVVLSLVMVAGLATVDASTAQAAKKAKKLSIVSTGKKNVKSGQKRTIKIKGTNAKKAKWSVSGTGKSYVKLAKKKGKKVSFTVKANATGKAKITAKLTKKNKVSYTYKLSCDATAIALEGKDVYTGVVENLALTVIPTNAKLNADVAYGVFSDETVETATTDAVVTAGAMGCEFYTAKAGTYYVKATAGEMVSIAKVTAAERVAKLESVQQTKANELAVTFDSDASKVEAADVIIKNGNGVVMTVKSVTVDKDDKTKATITTFSNMTDGAPNNSITYKDVTLEFQASNGEVASIEITPETAPINTAVPLKALVLDLNKVELASFVYGKQPDNYTFEVSGDASADSDTGKITFENIGATATVTITYDTGKTDAAGNPITVVSKKVITAVAEGNITGVNKFKFIRRTSKPEDSDQTYDAIVTAYKNDAKDKVRVENGDDQKNYYLYAVVTDDNGYEKVNGPLSDKYLLESSDPDKFIMYEDEIRPNREGKASILVKDKENDDKVLFTIPVEVEAASKLTKFELKQGTSTTMKLTTADKKDPGATDPVFDSGSFQFKAYDQYNEEYKAVELTATATNEKNAFIDVEPDSTALKVNVSVNTIGTGSSIGAGYIPTKSSVEINRDKLISGKEYINPGDSPTANYTIEAKDKESDAKLSRPVYINLSRPTESETNVSLVVDTTSLDTALVDKEAKAGKVAEFKLAVYDSKGVFARYDYLPSASSLEYLKGNTVLKFNADVASMPSFTLDANNTANLQNVTPGSFIAVTDSNLNLTKKVYLVGSKPITVSITGSAFGGNETPDVMSTGYTVIKRTEGEYGLRVKKVKMTTTGDNRNKVDYANGATQTKKVKVVNSQKDITVQLNVRNGLSGQPSQVAAQAFKVTAGDTQDYLYNAEEPTKALPYVFAIGKNGHKMNSNDDYAFTSLTIYVPYRIADKDSGQTTSEYIYNEVANKSVNGVVTK